MSYDTGAATIRVELDSPGLRMGVETVPRDETNNAQKGNMSASDPPTSDQGGIINPDSQQGITEQTYPQCTEIVQQDQPLKTDNVAVQPAISAELVAFYHAINVNLKISRFNGIPCILCIHPKRLEADSTYLRTRSIGELAETLGVEYGQAYTHVRHSGLMEYNRSRAGIAATADRFVRSGLTADAKASDGVKALELIARLEGHLKTDTQESTETILDAIRKQTGNKQQGATIIEDAEYVIVADDLPVEQEK